MLTISPAKPEETPLLQSLIEKSVRGLSTTHCTEKQIERALIHVFGVDSQLITDQTYYVVRDGGQIAGCGGWSKRNTLFGGDQTKGTEDPLLDPQTDAARIRAFFVHPDWARKGVGTSLLNFCTDAAAAAGFHQLQLAATQPGVPFYSRLGFSLVENKEIVLADGETLPLAVMQKAI